MSLYVPTTVLTAARVVFLCLLLLADSRHFHGVSAAVTLITFDVDGTLVKGSGRAPSDGAHAKAFQHAVSEILGKRRNDIHNSNNKSDNDEMVVPKVADVLPRRLYHGSTDGLILLRYAKAALQVEPKESFPQLNTLMDCMYAYMLQLNRNAVAEYLDVLPGVLDTLTHLSTMQDTVKCGLVTGNVEGIARLKMEAVGIWQTQALHPPCASQKTWSGTEHLAFLGGFGSDFCSGNIDDLDRNFLDRGEQIEIAAKRCQELLSKDFEDKATMQGKEQNVPCKTLKKVVHVGDAPADVLAAKALANKNPEYCVGMVAVATGSYPADELRALIGKPIPGRWEPVVLEQGLADTNEFIKACGI